MSSESQTAPPDNIAISVRNLTKTYRLFDHPGDRIKQFISFGLKQYHHKFTALNDVSFDIKKGETIGIIGRNGSGKSTLLQLICGILKPTAGTVKVNGRISALLELGAGFNPEFTGRENVYFHGALIGFCRAQMEERFEAIAAFADIGEFIDQPVRTYSTGMFVRLAFASATHSNPDVLVVDEALSVGDTHFQSKCFERMGEIRAAGGTILFVSHSAEQIAHHCSQAIWLDSGQLIRQGDPLATLQGYLSPISSHLCIQNRKGEIASEEFTNHPSYNSSERRWGNGEAAIESVQLVQKEKTNPAVIVHGAPLEISFVTRFSRSVAHPIFGLTIKDIHGTPVFSANSNQLIRTPVCAASEHKRIQARFLIHPFLDTGEYLLSFGAVEQTPSEINILDRRYDAIRMQVIHPASTEHITEMAAECRLSVLA